MAKKKEVKKKYYVITVGNEIEDVKGSLDSAVGMIEEMYRDGELSDKEGCAYIHETTRTAIVRKPKIEVEWQK